MVDDDKFRRMQSRLADLLPRPNEREFATLEPLGPDEAGIALDLGLPVDELVARASTAVVTAVASPVHHNGKEARP